jgi:hypothetical protein
MARLTCDKLTISAFKSRPDYLSIQIEALFFCILACTRIEHKLQAPLVLTWRERHLHSRSKCFESQIISWIKNMRKNITRSHRRGGEEKKYKNRHFWPSHRYGGVSFVIWELWHYFFVIFFVRFPHHKKKHRRKKETAVIETDAKMKPEDVCESERGI